MLNCLLLCMQKEETGENASLSQTIQEHSPSQDTYDDPDYQQPPSYSVFKTSLSGVKRQCSLNKVNTKKSQKLCLQSLRRLLISEFL